MLRARGVVLVDLLVAAVLMGVALAVLVGMAGRALSSQSTGERLATAAMLADEQLNLVLARGPDQYASRYEVEGACEAPFESFRYRLDVGGGGAGGEADEVAATILWREGDRERTIRVDTLMASRLGEEADPDRKPKERVERPT